MQSSCWWRCWSWVRLTHSVGVTLVALTFLGNLSLIADSLTHNNAISCQCQCLANDIASRQVSPPCWPWRHLAAWPGPLCLASPTSPPWISLWLSASCLSSPHWWSTPCWTTTLAAPGGRDACSTNDRWAESLSCCCYVVPVTCHLAAWANHRQRDARRPTEERGGRVHTWCTVLVLFKEVWSEV